MTTSEFKKDIYTILEKMEKMIEFDLLRIINKYNLLSDTHKLSNRLDWSKNNENNYVYFIKNNINGYIKIGHTSNLKNRINQINSIFFSYFGTMEYVEIIRIIDTSFIPPNKIEKYFHNKYKDKRKFGEWFSLSDKDIHELRENLNILGDDILDYKYLEKLDCCDKSISIVTNYNLDIELKKIIYKECDIDINCLKHISSNIIYEMCGYKLFNIPIMDTKIIENMLRIEIKNIKFNYFKILKNELSALCETNGFSPSDMLKETKDIE